MPDIYTGTPVNMKTVIFNFQFLSHLCLDVLATQISRGTV